ncbi:hypothetical protein PZ897_17860 [Hoeflea sp. YIM 152468]|uniref:hypothetical protein n=1 Tax=Hoeflea sp. YIM 152468 TaxID=3031759 RepID=UPI0023D9FA97|nr:hypothetical protein [Hoeflea sp. YIM 152468]MDF1610050.1 hypothetical protein [Hoeflea sp. YIM 152468]
MKRTVLIAMLGLVLLSAIASAEPFRSGRRLDAIQSGRLYDPILTPQLNPSFEFNDPNAEAIFLNQMRRGRVRTDAIPEAQRQYFQWQLDGKR